MRAGVLEYGLAAQLDQPAARGVFEPGGLHGVALALVVEVDEHHQHVFLATLNVRTAPPVGVVSVPCPLPGKEQDDERVDAHNMASLWPSMSPYLSSISALWA